MGLVVKAARDARPLLERWAAALRRGLRLPQ